MKFVFDLDGTLSFDGMTMDKHLQEVLLSAPSYGHEVIFATARSYRDSLGILEGNLAELAIVGLNGGTVHKQGNLVSQYSLHDEALQAILDLCRTYNIPYFIDNAFDYALQNPEQIPFISLVDPMHKAKAKSIQELSAPVKAVLALAEHQDILEDIINQLAQPKSLDLIYQEQEKCLYINPKGVTKASTVLNHFGPDYIAFGNDKNDIPLFREALYGVQIGDFPYLENYADEQLPTDSCLIALRIKELFEKFSNK